MKIVKLHKPQRMGSLENVLAYSGEEDEQVQADSTATDSTGVQITERGFSTTSQDSTGRITFELNSPVWIADGVGPDSTDVDSLRVNLTGPFGASIDIAIPLPVDSEGGNAVPQPDYTMPGDVEYDQYGRKLVH
ncbi:MAG: hypothetical protein F4W91_13835 [Gemmatimonadetes bacterium]|nr:hypothetical protein [Gemmatimonadota bacterium]